MADVDAVLLPFARVFYEEIATDLERAHLDDVITLIRLNPDPDGELIFPFDLGLRDTSGMIYYDGWVWVIFRRLNNWTLAILNIGFEEEIPRPHRPAT